MGDISVQLYCLNCEEYYADDQLSFSELWNTQLCAKCNFPLLSKEDAEDLIKAFEDIEKAQEEGGAD